MKKRIFALVLFIFTLANIHGQNDPKDLILLLDTSASMSASYENVNNYLSASFLSEHLRIGDTFHFIPFSDKPRLDIARLVEGRGELETIIGRMLLQSPLDSWSDIEAALKFAEVYANALPQRPKRIVLITDGIADPPPGSSSRALDTAGLNNLVSETRDRLGSRGISLSYIKVSPGVPLPSASRPATAAASPQATSSAAPPPASTRPAEQARPVEQVRPTEQARPVETRPAETGPAAGLSSSVAPPPITPPQESSREQQSYTEIPPKDDFGSTGGETLSTEERPAVEQQPQVTPAAPPPVVTPPPATQQASRRSWDGPPLPLLIGLALIGLIALILIILLISRQLHSSPNRAIARAASPSRAEPVADAAPFTDHSKDLASFAAGMSKHRSTPYEDRKPTKIIKPIDYSQPVMLNLFVEDQNTFIGKRNIHSVKSGNSFTVGGGKSDFLIFLVPIPPAIGDVTVGSGGCTFTPRKAKYFPDIGSQPVHDCIGKTIRIVSDKNYELRFRFERYEDPLQALNRLMNSVKIPGEVDF